MKKVNTLYNENVNTLYNEKGKHTILYYEKGKHTVQGNPAKPTEKINISLLTIPLIKNIHLLAGPPVPPSHICNHMCQYL